MLPLTVLPPHSLKSLNLNMQTLNALFHHLEDIQKIST